MSGYMCSTCAHTFTSRIGYSQYRNSYNRPSNENTVNLFSRTSENKSFSSKKISISSIKFEKQSHNSADNFSQIASKEENLYNISKDVEIDNNILFELEDKNDMSFKIAANNNKEFFEILQDTLQNFKDIAKEIEPFKSCDELSSSDEDNSKIYKDFLNKAYADLMALVTKFKLSNAVGNAIIKFFNKYSKLSKSLLPSNISQGKIYMNNMESDLSYKKTCVLKHNDSEYFLHYIPILKCIKNILKVSNLIQNFATDYEELSKISKNDKEIFYREQNNGIL
ncbi:zn-finger domain-containing protein [Gigaspora margarita]|uniref:Zn-finger domain-containing protein n=1 Tax=Gigaspora margarita TaxID=4874 RepID=A0A8H4ENN9_GIGMA|nr:zn-finger domain-containing protein [Gigaspora margarita]